jgi:hypothetical protein
MPDGTKIPAEFLTHDQFLDAFRVPLRVPMNVDASCGKKWPEVGTEWLGPDQGVGKGGGSGVGVRKDKDTEGAILDTEASGTKEYLMGLDIGMNSDTTIMAEGHIDTDGVLVIDRIIQPKPELGVLVGQANQGL